MADPACRATRRAQPESQTSVNAGNAQALPSARAAGNVDGRFVPRSARCILFARPEMAGIFLRADKNTRDLRAPGAPGFFSDCGRNFADVRWDCLLRTGEPCDPRSRPSPTGDFFGFCALENRVCRSGAARKRTMTDHRMRSSASLQPELDPSCGALSGLRAGASLASRAKLHYIN